VALYVLPCLLPAPMIKYGESVDHRRRKKTWRPTVTEMMQACIIIVYVGISTVIFAVLK